MLKQTSLHAEHVKLGALMVDFAGWSMPLHYGSQITEHHAVRQDAGMFDVSHMGVIDITGQEAAAFLRYVLANNIDKLKTTGRALYSCLLNHQGGVIDDLIVYYISPTHYRCIVNAGTLAKDLAWFLEQAQALKPALDPEKTLSVKITHQPDYAILAVQGPNAKQKVVQALQALASTEPPAFSFLTDRVQEIITLKPFHFIFHQDSHINDILIASTGYTGEAGVEIVLPNQYARLFWQALLQQNVKPIGLGARDTLRLEAGLNLYGQDMDENVTPLESNLSWTLAFEPKTRDFIGREALEKQLAAGFHYQLTGIRLLDKGVLRHDQTIWVAKEQVGKITSGSFSPTLNQSIALARIRKELNNGCQVEIRGKYLQAEITTPPFVKRDASKK